MTLFLTPRNKDGTSTGLPEPLRLDRGEAIIGRGADAQLVLANPSISRRHCTVSGEGAAWQVVDTSTGGTLLNGQRLAGPQKLGHGDVLTLAEIEVAVTLEAGAGLAARSGSMNLDSWQRGAQTMPHESSAATPGASAGAWDTTQPPTRAASAPDSWGRTQPPAASSAPAQRDRPPSPVADTGPAAQLLQAAGLSRGQVSGSDEQVLATAGALLRASLAGLSAMLAAKRKARREMGAKDEAAGPLEAADALAKMLNASPAPAAETVASAFAELGEHERATLAAMQAAFAAALDQFAPEAIKLRASSDAAAWKTYEQAFGASDGFVDMFARELAKALS